MKSIKNIKRKRLLVSILTLITTMIATIILWLQGSNPVEVESSTAGIISLIGGLFL